MFDPSRRAVSDERRLFQTLDYGLLAAAVLLYAVGVLTIFSAANGTAGKGAFFAGKQLLWGGASLVVFTAVLKIDFEYVLSRSYWFYGLCCCLLIALFFMGHRAKGAQSWISMGYFKVQPAEFTKLALAFVLAHQLTQRPPADWRSFLLALGLGSVSAVLVLVQPDLGSTLVYAAMIFVALLVAGAPNRCFLSLISCASACLPVLWFFLKDYQKKRILVFVNPELDPLGAGYNVIQSRIAVGSGRLLGKGFMEGTQSKLRFLPEPHTDFIFSVFAEEFGLLGCLLLLSLLSFIIWRMIRIALRSRNIASKILISSLTASFWFHSFESIGMSMGLLPVTGLPLPLMSYGGSSLLSTVIALAVVVKIGALDEIERLENAVPGEPSLYDL